MATETDSSDPNADDNSGGNKLGGKSSRLKDNPAIIVALVAAVGGIIAAAVTGIFGLLGNSSTSPPKAGPSKADCPGFRADVDIPPQVGQYPALTINFECPPVAGQQYLWVIASEVTNPPHDEYYPKQFESGVQVGIPYTTSLDLHDDKIGQRNCIYVISVTEQQLENIESNLNENNFTLELPAGIARVSAPACEQRVK